MAEQANNLDPKEIEQLRESVLKWIEPKAEPVIVMPPLDQSFKAKETLKPKTKSGYELIKKITRINFLSGKNQRPPNGQPKKFFRLILAIAAFALLIAGFQAYLMLSEPDNVAVKFITRYLPFPAATVNDRVIPYYRWLRQSELLDLYYQKTKKADESFQVPDQRESRSRTLQRLIEEELIYQYFTQSGLTLAKEEIEDQFVLLAGSFGSENEFLTQIEEKYGWSLDDFIEIIFKPLLIKNKLSLQLLDHPQNQQAWLTAQDILRQIKTQKNSFENLAQKYSNDSSAKSGGDIGYLSLAELNPEMVTALKGLKPGEVSQIIKTRLGFNIFRLDEILTDDNDQPVKVRLHQILVRSRDFSDFLDSFRKKSTVCVFLNF